ncbi:insulinase family protein [Kamptonema cortianum]|nr:insulinase family protein [Geitlerinema splendidum]MDK3156026.1 insulinase family protein [Kamptonema cortianum]
MICATVGLCTALLVTQPAIQDKQRLDLSNGARILVERRNTPGVMHAVLVSSYYSMPETTETHGIRHLIEHIAAKGQDKLLDRKLETSGMTLSAVTDRDATTFTVTGSGDQVGMAMSAFNSIMLPLRTTQEEIEKEIKILQQEFALVSGRNHFADAGWLGQYGDLALNSFGNLEVMAKQTPESLQAAHAEMFLAPGTILYICGDIEPRVALEHGRELLTKLRQEDLALAPRRKVERPIKRSIAKKGESRSADVAGLGVPMTTAIIGASLAFQATYGGIEVVYEPSCWPGVVTVYSPVRGRLSSLEKLTPNDIALLGPQARYLAALWAKGLQREDLRGARLRAKIFLQRPSFQIETLETQALGLTNDEIERAFARLKADQAAVVEGF